MTVIPKATYEADHFRRVIEVGERIGCDVVAAL